MDWHPTQYGVVSPNDTTAEGVCPCPDPLSLSTPLPATAAATATAMDPPPRPSMTRRRIRIKARADRPDRPDLDDDRDTLCAPRRHATPSIDPRDETAPRSPGWLPAPEAGLHQAALTASPTAATPTSAAGSGTGFDYFGGFDPHYDPFDSDALSHATTACQDDVYGWEAELDRKMSLAVSETHRVDVDALTENGDDTAQRLHELREYQLQRSLDSPGGPSAVSSPSSSVGPGSSIGRSHVGHNGRRRRSFLQRVFNTPEPPTSGGGSASNSNSGSLRMPPSSVPPVPSIPTSFRYGGGRESGLL